jgi:hypothetical protein
MQDSAWVALLRVLPPAAHANLMLVTTIGQEIAIRDVLRMEADYLMIRGRMAGTTDAGRVFMIPYTSIHYLAFQNAMKVEEVNAVFSGTQTIVEAPQENRPTPPDPGPQPAVPVVPAQRSPAPESPVVALEKAKPESKVVLLERVRARLAAQAKSKGPS